MMTESNILSGAYGDREHLRNEVQSVMSELDLAMERSLKEIEAEDVKLRKKIEKDLFTMGMRELYQPNAIDDIWKLLEESNILDCHDDMKAIISPMDWGDIPYIIHVYVCSHAAMDNGYKIKDEYDLGWISMPHLRTH